MATTQYYYQGADKNYYVAPQKKGDLSTFLGKTPDVVKGMTEVKAPPKFSEWKAGNAAYEQYMAQFAPVAQTAAPVAPPAQTGGIVQTTPENLYDPFTGISHTTGKPAQYQPPAPPTAAPVAPPAQTGGIVSTTPENLYDPFTGISHTTGEPAQYNQPVAPVAPVAPINQPPTGTTAPSQTISDKTAEINKQIQDQFTEFSDKVSAMQKENQAKQDEIFNQIGAQANEDLAKQFKEMQVATKEAMDKYYADQTAALTEMQAQPSALQNLQTFREQQGLPQMEQQLALVDQTILQTEGLMANLEADIRKRTEGLPVTEAAARRLTAMEQAPLSKQLSEQIRARQTVAAGLEQKQANVQQFMGAAQEDLQRQKDIMSLKLGFGKEQAEFGVGQAEQLYSTYTDMQNRLTDVAKMKLETGQSSFEFSQNLLAQNFSLFSQFKAAELSGFTEDKQNELALLQTKLKEQGALDRAKEDKLFELQKLEYDWQQKLVMEQLKSDLMKANPEVKNVTSATDDNGNLTTILTMSDGAQKVITTPGVGKTKSNLLSPTEGDEINLNTTNKNRAQALGLNQYSIEVQNKALRLSDAEIREFVKSYEESARTTGAGIDPNKFLDRFIQVLDEEKKKEGFSNESLAD